MLNNTELVRGCVLFRYFLGLCLALASGYVSDANPRKATDLAPHVSILRLEDIQTAVRSEDSAVVAMALRKLWDAPDFVCAHESGLALLTREPDASLDPARVLQGSMRPRPFWASYSTKMEILLGIMAESARYQRYIEDIEPSMSEFHALISKSMAGNAPIPSEVAIDCLFHSVFFEPPVAVAVNESDARERVVDTLIDMLYSGSEEGERTALIKLKEAAYAAIDRRDELVALLDSENWAGTIERGGAAYATDQRLTHAGEPLTDQVLRSVMSKSQGELLAFVTTHETTSVSWAIHQYALGKQTDQASNRDAVVQKLISSSRIRLSGFTAGLPQPFSVDTTDAAAKKLVESSIRAVMTSVKEDEADSVLWAMRTLRQLISTRQYEQRLYSPLQEESNALAVDVMVPYGTELVTDAVIEMLNSKNLATQRAAALELGMLCKVGEQSAAKANAALSAALTETVQTYNLNPGSSDANPAWVLHDDIANALQNSEEAVAFYAIQGRKRR